MSEQARDERLAAIQSRIEATTPEPWEVVGAKLVACLSEDGGTIAAVSDPRATPDIKYTELGIGAEDFHEACANAEFIAHARQDVPWLLEENERLERALLARDKQYHQFMAQEPALRAVATAARVTVAASVLWACRRGEPDERERMTAIGDAMVALGRALDGLERAGGAENMLPDGRGATE